MNRHKSILFTPDEIKKIEVAGQENGRSFSSEVRWRCRQMDGAGLPKKAQRLKARAP